MDAAYLGMSKGKLRLHKTNGVIVEVPAEKMSAEDMKYAEKMEAKKKGASRKVEDDDDLPLAIAASKRMSQAPKKPTIDWFEFFLSAGCDIDDCSRYAASFERDKMDESILPDITDSTMRSLGLREGDIIRVTKAITSRKPKEPKPVQGESDQMSQDEEMAKRMQAEENARKTPPALFSGPGGTLKTNRRGRPTPSRSTPSATVDLNAIGTIAGGGIPRTDSPKLVSSSPGPVNPPARSSSAMPAASSGFDDDAWAPRNKPATPGPDTRAPSAPPAPVAAPVAPPPPVQPPVASPPPPVQSTQNLANTTESDIFNQLARLTELRKNTPQQQPMQTPSPALQSTPTGYPGGMGPPSQSPMLQQPLQQQQQPQQQQQQQYNGPRGPFAPVPSNQGLLQPLVPTQTGFNSFIPTRINNNNVSPFGNQNAISPFANPQPSFLQSQPTGYPMQQQQPMQSQPTGWQPTQQQQQPQPTGFQPQLMSQPTGMPFNGMNGGMNSLPVSATNSYGSTGSFGSIPTSKPLLIIYLISYSF